MTSYVTSAKVTGDFVQMSENQTKRSHPVTFPVILLCGWILEYGRTY